jgi:hypothetical protein
MLVVGGIMRSTPTLTIFPGNFTLEKLHKTASKPYTIATSVVAFGRVIFSEGLRNRILKIWLAKEGNGCNALLQKYAPM